MSGRWYCDGCGIVRDAPGEHAPFCRHNAPELPARRMIPIPPYHPYATGPLPWGTSDPSSTRSSS